MQHSASPRAATDQATRPQPECHTCISHVMLLTYFKWFIVTYAISCNVIGWYVHMYKGYFFILESDWLKCNSKFIDFTYVEIWERWEFVKWLLCACKKASPTQKMASLTLNEPSMPLEKPLHHLCLLLWRNPEC